ncbi:Thioredoxin family protein [Candidatus Bealeia paramacronuclearis]|uniref:Thioredoxin family protein n=1 Tax=Candidatus Bealeia paramacronuclearis TaxID=1921001 RepID=A0ABZ2C5J7_9PROT|nr:Thioredoxin family protein [Candidatus Bealeia paramacronuclearis]
MSLTPSTMMPLGTTAPSFELLDVISGSFKKFNDLKSQHGTVVMFICNHCPFVKHIQSELFAMAKAYQNKGISFIAINANDVENYPEDSPENMKRLSKELNYELPYLFDETQEVAKAYEAACTPDFFVFDSNLKCVYRGQFDDSRPGNGVPVTGADLKDALEALLHHHPISSRQKPSIGCNIKWKAK